MSDVGEEEDRAESVDREETPAAPAESSQEEEQEDFQAFSPSLLSCSQNPNISAYGPSSVLNEDELTCDCPHALSHEEAVSSSSSSSSLSPCSHPTTGFNNEELACNCDFETLHQRSLVQAGKAAPVQAEEGEEEAAPVLVKPGGGAGPTSPSAGESGEDDVDGWISAGLIGTVKLGLLHLLNLVIGRYQKETCYGCRTNHPSQKHHPCLDVETDGYFSEHYDRLMARLFTPKLFPSIQKLLILRKIRSDEERIRAIVETLIFEVKSVRRVAELICDFYDSDVGQSVTTDQLSAVSDCWKSE
ncbi:uncharacterized protein LOC115393948 isoform X2 [Salarias fasciatus]|uniref:uncharacterized protein LOC115393948 isoform X2 n=1 Tax=Salarias fasciatus TaxID=181472 RepID=UPI001176A8EA|nr:uncharacterized protein LOC115393948 isoform X2 [Salarias fasciatus]XP_029954922.1 uncharacterized protein LOC115393948 isoform X2 [Salarias fasciatus]